MGGDPRRLSGGRVRVLGRRAVRHGALDLLRIGAADLGTGTWTALTQVAADAGLHYDFGIARHANTRKAHELLHYAKSVGRQSEMAERLFAAHFTEGKFVGGVAELADLAAEIGLDRDAGVVADLEAQGMVGAASTEHLLAELGEPGTRAARGLDDARVHATVHGPPVGEMVGAQVRVSAQ